MWGTSIIPNVPIIPIIPIIPINSIIINKKTQINKTYYNYDFNFVSSRRTG